MARTLGQSPLRIAVCAERIAPTRPALTQRALPAESVQPGKVRTTPPKSPLDARLAQVSHAALFCAAGWGFGVGLGVTGGLGVAGVEAGGAAALVAVEVCVAVVALLAVLRWLFSRGTTGSGCGGFWTAA